MKKHIIMAIFALSIIFCGIQLARADDLPATSLPMSTIIKNLQAKGFVAIEKIKYEDKTYEAKVLDKAGEQVDVSVNPQTGLVAAPKAHLAKITILDAAQKVEAAGYHNIFKIVADDDKFKVKALDKQGKKVELEVNTQNGDVRKD